MTSEQKLIAALQDASKAIEEMQQEKKEKVKVNIYIPKTYETVTGLSKVFECTTRTIYNKLPEFEAIVKSGRYGNYGTLKNLYSVAAFADFLKYQDWFKEKNLKKNIPPFNPYDALFIIIPELKG